MQIYGDKLFSQPIDRIIAFDNDSFKKSFEQIECYKKAGKYLLGYIRYEAKNIFLGQKYSSQKPILYFEVFENYETYTPIKNKKIIYPIVKNLVSKTDYVSDIEKIKNYIADGITYEVNYTYPSEVVANCTSIELYGKLLENQRTPYNTYIQNEYETLLSFTPELFFRIDGNKITTKPMKGTVKRGKTEQEDKANVEFLSADEKNKAENVMIVDLLRNDLSRIAKTGTVKVEKLFEIETHKTVHQMTSTISAILEENTTLYKIFESIFPCGSITGAPKISTMRVIDELEHFERGIYCGAIGYISPEETVFSVPIRILVGNNNKYLCHTGGAIVWDSDSADEWEETIVKRKFLETIPSFNLIETMKAENGKIIFLKEHIDRLKHSAKILGFEFDDNLYTLKSKKDGIVRILLSKNGKTDIEYKKLEDNKTTKIRFANKVVNSDNVFLYHKTDYRKWYDSSIEAIRNGEIYDEIYINEKCEITEGARSNIVIQKNGNLYTPPLDSGILNGIYRQSILNKLEEKVLYKEDILNADKIFCINSVRGMVEVELC
ncbi:MAG: aminodeoxychorismate synthase component I [Candidatus Gastranaerophilales bacterium]|nr:aminodeoxychorismate synthase component I [Candidatus Gastranaerophilales bacterium]